MYEQVSQYVLFGLDRETLIVCVSVVDELHVQVGPDGSSHLPAELEHSEGVITGLLILTKLVLILQLVHEVLVFLRDQALHLWKSLLNGKVPHLWLAAKEPLSILALNQALQTQSTCTTSKIKMLQLQ